jgi:hypothetical protein
MLPRLALLFGLLTSCNSQENSFGELIFEDKFERSESQELKNEPGNEWTTSSERTAYGEKEVDLRDGHMYVYRHKKAWHATSVRHAFAFKDGTIGIKLKFDDIDDSISLNFTDLGEKSVHAGHLFNVSISPTRVFLQDLKTGVHNLKIKKAKKEKTLTTAQKKELASKSKKIKNSLELGKWHQIYATVIGDEVSCTINGKLIASFKAPGFAHETKTLIRLLVNKNVHIDDVKIWRKKAS